MGYTTDYSTLKGIAKHNAAIKDAKNYMGTAQFNKLIKAIQKEEPQMSLTQVRYNLDWIGIRGYPVRAIYYHCFAELPNED